MISTLGDLELLLRFSLDKSIRRENLGATTVLNGASKSYKAVRSCQKLAVSNSAFNRINPISVGTVARVMVM